MNPLVSAFFAYCRNRLEENHFCILISQEQITGQGIAPLPWRISTLARKQFRLRDEKIGIFENNRELPVYINVMQAAPENGAVQNMPELQIGKPAVRESWLMVKPRPREKE